MPGVTHRKKTFFQIAQHVFLTTKWLKRVHVPPAAFIYMMSLTEPTYGYAIAPGWVLLGIIFRKVVHRWWSDRYAFLFQIAFPNWWGTQMDFYRLAYANVDGKILDH
ncbi:unnamed protein product [Adineta ricciae]|uniref:Uncharacterized protein n=1 Tax=Adineta ricciae TaxID=249248 RepID=A0A815AQT0_ADIRI|nr:unnamed protein product [Adineta ricciae]